MSPPYGSTRKFTLLVSMPVGNVTSTGPVVAPVGTVVEISERYFFWTGEAKIDSATGDWQRTLKGVFELADIPDGHAHRFRDTFAVGLLQAGVPIERVSVLLGHSSIKVTEKYYSPWVRARQEQLEADVRRSWAPPDQVSRPVA
jgi:hypothetical protein